jgi:ATP-dependent DNA helicase RecQ
MTADDLLKHTLLLDLETTKDGKIYEIGAAFNERSIQKKNNPIGLRDLEALDAFAKKARFILGHNIIEHDLPLIRAVAPHLELHQKPIIDTLYLSPLAFPHNPYHRLIKDYKLVRDTINDPVADARLAASIFKDQWESFTQTAQKEPELMTFYRFCFRDKGPTGSSQREGIALVFGMLGGMDLEDASEALSVFEALSSNLVCKNHISLAVHPYLAKPETRPVLTYALAWLRVAGGNSVLPSWVRHRFPDIVPLLKQLRDLPCEDSACPYCGETHNPEMVLQKYFGFRQFRDMPDGRTLQRDIVAAGMAENPLLGILPTGFGKSICFQLPALARFYRRGVLTIVISPLQSLMKDQVDNLSSRVKTNAVAAIYGLLTPPERGAILEKVRLGDIGLLYISPEQLRNRSLVEILKQREIGCWVFDEAHCLSKWGHDFRPDYLYVSRFIREYAESQRLPIPPVACLTATAKLDVIAEIRDHFKNELSQPLELFLGGLERTNLRFFVQTVGSHEKWSAVHDLLKERLGEPPTGSAVVYCATVRRSEDVANFLAENGWKAEAYHGRLSVPDKRRVQEAFIADELSVICATNAFGMGIDKENVRLVIHADIPGSLENYLQEAGRAGRDNKEADCFLLYDENDVETQFRLGAFSELGIRDIQQILRGLRRARKNEKGEVIITTGELLRDERVETSFDSEDIYADTKVKNAIAWLERSGFLERNENRTSVFMGKPRFRSLEEVRPKLDQLSLSRERRLIWETILQNLVNRDPNEGMSADELAEALGRVGGISPEYISDTRKIIRILNEMAEQGLIQSGMMLTAYLRPKGRGNARAILGAICDLDQTMIGLLREEHPEDTGNEWLSLDIRRLNQRLVDAGSVQSNPEILRRLFESLAMDGKGFAGRHGSIDLRQSFQDQCRVKLLRNWQDISTIAERRRRLASVLLEALYARIPEQLMGTAEVLVEFSVDDLTDAISRDLTLQVESEKILAAIDRGLLFLHEHRVIILQRGLSVFRQALTVRVFPEGRGRRYTKGDYAPLEHHYQQRIFQVHVMNEYARVGLEKVGRALALVAAYFSLDNESFIRRFFAHRRKMLELATSEMSFKKIVDHLRNPIQEAIVADSGEENALILAGPGSGKTLTVVHRCAYLLRVKRIPGRSVLILCFNHNAALTIRRRLWDLVGQDAAGVAVLTYHGLAMRLLGVSFAEEMEKGFRNGIDLKDRFENILQEAIALLKGEKDVIGLAPDEIREKLLAGYQYILVDEYQDIDAVQYDMISALTGRTLQDKESRLSILAVGDDDQSIYGFRHANVRFIRQFQTDYKARIHHLVENYRSTQHIIEAANALIAKNSDRMKAGHPIRINTARRSWPPGGRWEKLDPVMRGMVQRLTVDDLLAQAECLAQEIIRIRELDGDLDYGRIAVLARAGMAHKELAAARTALTLHGMPVSIPLDREAGFPLARVREIQMFLEDLRERKNEICSAQDLIDRFEAGKSKPLNSWEQAIWDLLIAWQTETGNSSVFLQEFIDFTYESLAERRREMRYGKGIFLSTVHGVKGMEFDHVFILDGVWPKSGEHADREEERRLYYVAMTRARETLCVFKRLDCENPHLECIDEDHVIDRPISVPKKLLDKIKLNTYSILGLKHLYIGFAGNYPENAEIHRALGDLSPGDPLFLKNGRNCLKLCKKDKTEVAQLSKAGYRQWHDKIHSIEDIRVLAMVKRKAEDGDSAHADRFRCDQWELPVVEIRTGFN